jgi:hypothetical protein
MRARILNLIHEVEYCCVSAKLDYINSAWKSVATIASELGVLISYAKDCIAEDEYLYFIGDLQDIIPRFMESQKGRDLILAADVLEAELLPWLSGKAAELSSGNVDEDFDFWDTNLDALEVSGNYGLLKMLTEGVTDSGSVRVRCDYASSGDICFKCVDGYEFYLTGRNYPYTDALYYVYESRNDYDTCYGLGGGCMIYELLALMRINISTKAVLFEQDKELLVNIFKHINLKDVIESGRVSFCYENIPQNLGKFITGINLWTKTSSVKFEKDEMIRYAYEKYRSILLSSKEEKYLLFFNFAENAKFEDEYVTEITDRVEGKTIYFIAGGPSLNRCFDILKNRDENSFILTVGTSAGKLLKEGIAPDFVIISDPLPAMKKQLDQPFDYDKTSLLYLCTTYNYAVESFRGKRYIVYQKDFAKAEELAANGNYPLFLTGGSVSTLALDILLGLRAERVICLGLDLAYTYNQMHAAGIHAVNDAPTDIQQNMVRATNGKTVSSPNNLNSYREWIVDRLRNYEGDTRLINVSDGAYIDGMENYTCEEYLKR